MDVRKKIFIDLFAAPTTLVPVVGGISTLIGSWAFGPFHPIVKFVGVVGIIAGIGTFLSRCTKKGLAQITEEAYQHVHKQKVKKEELALDELDSRLVKDRDPRTQTLLRNLRKIYDIFRTDIDEGNVMVQVYELVDTVDDLFLQCVEQLKHSYDLWEHAKQLSNSSKENILEKREKVIGDVEMAVDRLNSTIEEFHSFTVSKNRDTLSSLCENLDASMKVARRVQRRLETLEEPETQFDEIKAGE